MTHRVGMSQVKFKVRYHALLLREFTVADIIRATGLNPESVRTELQRMRQEGLLTSQPHSHSSPERHGRPALYRLTDDPEARLALSRSIEAFYPTPPASNRPTSRHYLAAQRLLDQALNTAHPQRQPLLTEAEQALDMAEHAEGGHAAPESVKAYMQYERARLDYLRGDYEQAARTFDILHEFFHATHDESMLKRVAEFQLCLKVRRRFAAKDVQSVGEAAVGWYLAEALIEQDYQADSPITSLLLPVLRQLSETASEKVSAALGKDLASGDRHAQLVGAQPDYPRHLVGKAITHLPPEQQQVITLKFFVGLSTREIAETLGRTEATIKALQQRAINQLQYLLLNGNQGSVL
ncbi:MAG TPA: sigma-70 family RNA polymerase sigma factor [Herpetosiphonaceae bacterium]